MAYPTVFSVLNELETLIPNVESRPKTYRRIKARDYCSRLSIFDWWKEYLTLTDLKTMRAFLRTAQQYGYNGYCCFKVGKKYCANGMWANKAESTDGYSPDGECLYRSFTTDYTAWDAELANGIFVHELLEQKGIAYDKIRFKDIEPYIS